MAKKRLNGGGSIWKLKSGTWRGQLMDGYKPDGKKNVINFSAPTKGEVQDMIRDYQNLKDAHIHPDKNMLLSDWGDAWYRDYQSQVQASTYAGYHYTLEIIKKNMGGLPIADICPMDINHFMDELVQQGYGISQLRKCRTMLIQIFDSGEENGLILSNPARRAKTIRDINGDLSRPRYFKDAFTEEEWKILHERLPNTLMGNSILVMLESGIRVQELLGLSPEDIAEDGSTLTVRKAIKMVAGVPTLGPPKSKLSKREIPLPKRVWISAKYLRKNGGSHLIWSMSGNHPYYSVGSFRRRYYTTLREVGDVRLLSPHCCRHTYVTRLQARGVSMEMIAKLAGHCDVKTTNGYAHTSTETLRKAVEVLDHEKEG